MNPNRMHSRLRWATFVAFAMALVALCLFAAAPAAQAQSKAKKVDAAPKALAIVDPENLFGAIVKVSVQAVPDARSSATLGSEREGTGVVIGERRAHPDDRLPDRRSRRCQRDRQPRPDISRRGSSAYDHATGLGLLRTIAPIDATPVPFGDSGKLAESRSGDDRNGGGTTVSRLLMSCPSAPSPAAGNTRSIRRSSPPARAQLERRGVDRQGRKVARRRLADRA